jgi:ABC-type methionine transport system ATPase subunit
MSAFFELDDVYVQARHNDRTILSGITLEIASGDRCVVVGHSGAGKSTLLRLLNRMVDPHRGVLRVEGVPALDIPPARLRREVGLVFQEPIWLPGTMRDNLLAAGALKVVSPEAAESRLEEVLSLIGLTSDFLDRLEDELSVGERQRVVLGRALMTKPRALLLDEPTAALDPPSARGLLEQVRRLGELESLTMVLVTHRLEDARLFGEQGAVLEGGRLIDHGRASEILPRLESRWSKPGP